MNFLTVNSNVTEKPFFFCFVLFWRRGGWGWVGVGQMGDGLE